MTVHRSVPAPDARVLKLASHSAFVRPPSTDPRLATPSTNPLLPIANGAVIGARGPYCHKTLHRIFTQFTLPLLPDSRRRESHVSHIIV
jgi:hypothetical protein